MWSPSDLLVLRNIQGPVSSGPDISLGPQNAPCPFTALCFYMCIWGTMEDHVPLFIFYSTTFKTWFQYYLRVNTSLNLPELIELSRQWVNSSVPGSTMQYYHYFISHNSHYILYHIILFSPDCKLHEDKNAISPSSASLPLPQIHRPVLTSNVHLNSQEMLFYLLSLWIFLEEKL